MIQNQLRRRVQYLLLLICSRLLRLHAGPCHLHSSARQSRRSSRDAHPKNNRSKRHRVLGTRIANFLRTKPLVGPACHSILAQTTAAWSAKAEGTHNLPGARKRKARIIERNPSFCRGLARIGLYAGQDPRLPVRETLIDLHPNAADLDTGDRFALLSHHPNRDCVRGDLGHLRPSSTLKWCLPGSTNASIRQLFCQSDCSK